MLLLSQICQTCTDGPPMVTSLEATGWGWVPLLVATTVLLARVDWRGGSLLAKPHTFTITVPSSKPY